MDEYKDISTEKLLELLGITTADFIHMIKVGRDNPNYDIDKKNLRLLQKELSMRHNKKSKMV